MECQKRRIYNTKKFQVLYGSYDGVLEICESCLNVDSKSFDCQQCYGRVAVLTYELFSSETKQFTKQRILSRDRFVKIDDVIEKQLEVDELLNSCEIIREISKKEKITIGKTTFEWSYGDRPITYKTDCIDCKNKYGDLTPCLNTIGNKKNNLLPNFCAEQKQRILKF